MKKTLSERLNDKPFQGPGRLIFWVMLDLMFIGLSVWQNLWYGNHGNVLGSAVFLVLGILWMFNLWCDLDRWYVPKVFPATVPKARTLEDEE